MRYACANRTAPGCSGLRSLRRHRSGGAAPSAASTPGRTARLSSSRRHRRFLPHLPLRPHAHPPQVSAARHQSVAPTLHSSPRSPEAHRTSLATSHRRAMRVWSDEEQHSRWLKATSNTALGSDNRQQAGAAARPNLRFHDTIGLFPPSNRRVQMRGRNVLCPVERPRYRWLALPLRRRGRRPTRHHSRHVRLAACARTPSVVHCWRPSFSFAYSLCARLCRVRGRDEISD